MLLVPSHNYQKNFKQITFSDDDKGKTVHFCLKRGIDATPDFALVTSVAVVPFVSKETIMVTRLQRGVDIPGGHTESYDADVVATAQRESIEEAAIELDDSLYLIGEISSDYKGPTAEDVTYMLITAGRVTKVNEFIPEFESLGRGEMSLDDFLAHYEAGSQEMMAEIVNRAKDVRDKIFSR